MRAPLGARFRFHEVFAVMKAVNQRVMVLQSRQAAARSPSRSSLPAFSGWSNRADHVATFFSRVGDDLVCNLAAVDLDRSREVECDANSIALDRDDANDTNRGRWISDDDFFTFAACDDKHAWGPPALVDGPSATWLTGSDYPTGACAGRESSRLSFSNSGAD
jgi:hypothetical protein